MQSHVFYEELSINFNDYTKSTYSVRKSKKWHTKGVS